MKKLITILSFCFICVLPVLLFGCDKPGTSHTCEYKETYSADYKYHWFDSVCHNEEQYRLNKTEHFYSEFVSMPGGGFSRTCSVCSYEQKTTKDNFEVLPAEHGTVEIITESSGRRILLPKPDEGYYFHHWEKGSGTMKIENEPKVSYFRLNNYFQVQEVDAFTVDEISTLLGNLHYQMEQFKPVFTDNKNLFIDVSVNVTEDSGEVDVWYLPYCLKTEYHSYYVKEDQNFMIQSEEVNYGNYKVIDEDYPAKLPLVAHNEAKHNNLISEVNLTFVNTENKAIVEIYGDFGTYKKGPRYHVVDIGSQILLERDVYEVRSYLDSWTDENGNIISTDKKCVVTIEEDCKFYAIYKDADYEYKGLMYSYVDATQKAYRLEAVKASAVHGGEVITMPSELGGKPVVAISNYIFDAVTSYSFGGMVIPESVKYIESHAFDKVRCYNEKTMIFNNDGVVNISLEHFENVHDKLLIDVNAVTLEAMVEKYALSHYSNIIYVSFAEINSLGEGVNCSFDLKTKTITLCIDHDFDGGVFNTIERCVINKQYINDIIEALSVLED